MSLKSVMAKVAGIEQEKVELASQRVDLGLVEDIASIKKQAQQQLTRFLKSDAIVQKAVTSLKSVYPDVVANKDYSKKKTAELSKIEGNLTKQANDLGIDVKQLPAFKELMDAYSFLGQVDDAIMNSIGAVKNI